MVTYLIRTFNQRKVSLKAQSLAALLSVIAAVALPQFFHILGSISGVGTALGEILLPMHLPIIFIGILAGGYAGAASGLLAPLVSFVLTGMPPAPMLPFMTIELCAYGLFAGFLRNAKIPDVVKVILVQLAGRIVRAGAILLAVNILSVSSINPMTILTSIPNGLVGIVLQLVFIPLIMKCIKNYE